MHTDDEITRETHSRCGCRRLFDQRVDQVPVVLVPQLTQFVQDAEEHGADGRRRRFVHLHENVQ